ncbi:MAG: hypothetical protein ING00_08560 [Roseomonas sp.]|nr:hypothetical protein [Roseomonas sp.]MCA3305846.1 hypothetical protein [Roseomonas sp.]
MAGIVGTIWSGVALRRLKAGADPDSPPRAVAIPVPWEDEAGEALAALAPGSGPATLPSAAEAWIQRLMLRGRRLGLLDGADAAESLAAGLRSLILARRGAPGAEIWRDARGDGRFVLNLPAFLDGEGGFDAPAYRAACQLAVQTLDIWGHGKAESLRLGFADLAGLLAGFGLGYDSTEARDVAAAIAGLTRGAAEAESGRLAIRFGPRHAVALICPTPPEEAAIPGLAKAARAALAAAAASPGLRHRGCIALSPADAVEALLGAESAGIAPAPGASRPARGEDRRITQVPTRAAERAGVDAAWLLAPVAPQARRAMEAAVMPFLDAPPPAMPAPADLPEARRAAPRPIHAPVNRCWRVAIAGNRVAMRAVEDDRGHLREISFSLPREAAMTRALMEALAQAVSLGLAQGVPLASFVNAYAYAPGHGGAVEGDAGIRRATSVLDWAFRRLARDYLGREDLPDPVEEETLQPRAAVLPLLPLELPAHPSPRMRRQLRPAA